MRLTLRTAALVALPLAAAATFAPTAATAAPQPTFTLLGPGVQVPLYAGSGTIDTFVPDATELNPAVLSAPTARFVVTYHGFPAAAKASFQRAVNTWSVNVRSSVPILIDATYKALPQNVLGSAGPSAIYGNANTKTAAVAALADKLTGKHIASGPEITANFSSSFSNWYFGTGNSPSNTYDFQSVVTHELGHGLGFIGSAGISNGRAAVGFSQGYYFTYDRAIKNSAGRAITSFANGSAGLKAQLQSNQLFFDSAAVRNANGGKNAKIFAPMTWEPGSSYSHVDERAYPAGNKNSLMSPVLHPGEAIHSPGPIMLAVFRTMGW